MLCINITTTFNAPTKIGVLSIPTPFGHPDKPKWPWAAHLTAVINLPYFSGLCISEFSVVFVLSWYRCTEKKEKKNQNQPEGRRDVWIHTATGTLLWAVVFPASSFHPKRWILTSFPVPEPGRSEGLGTGAALAASARLPSLCAQERSTASQGNQTLWWRKLEEQNKFNALVRGPCLKWNRERTKALSCFDSAHVYSFSGAAISLLWRNWTCPCQLRQRTQRH